MIGIFLSDKKEILVFDGYFVRSKYEILEQKASWLHMRKKIDFENFVTHSVLVWTITTLVAQGNRVHVHVQLGCICAFRDTCNDACCFKCLS